MVHPGQYTVRLSDLQPRHSELTSLEKISLGLLDYRAQMNYIYIYICVCVCVYIYIYIYIYIYVLYLGFVIVYIYIYIYIYMCVVFGFC